MAGQSAGVRGSVMPAERPPVRRPLRVVVADDSPLVREGMVVGLVARGLTVVGRADNGDRALGLIAETEPDVAVIDIRMPPSGTGEGLRIAEQLDRERPATAVLIVSDYLEPAFARRLIHARTSGRGYLLKQTIGRLQEFTDAVERVAAGDCVVDPAIVERVLERRRATGPLSELSEREFEILALMAQGRSNRGLAERLVLSDRTVESHVRNIMRKLGVPEGPDDHRRVLAVLTYLDA